MTDYKMLFDTLYDRLCLYATHYVSSIDIAEDVVMEVMTKAYELEQQGGQITNTESYFFQAVKNNCLNYLHKKNTVQINHDIPDMVYDNEADREELARESRLWTAVESLPQKCRLVFLMSKRDGMKYQEIAEELGLSVKTVEAQIGKAYKVLRGKATEIYVFFFFL
ncbi:RNA polymerase sigma-70 factor [Prevotella cerevisiae]|uniref:RNA polymerase sigma-70 factor n=1 Tax=Segatella cerevisiae TaxID=2053716 RepID=A0ABT1BY35_9BACT|nr:RNA polymerase sigma-70 factor [Segatella cerevisiae]MCO6025987.1 RNA polymerase sigma-70 factor [Segatella cerevisiae]